MANALDAPARHSLVVQVVERKEDLGNAIALNSAMFNGARLVGPPMAGILVALAGEGICFLINGVSYLAVIFALLAMKFPARAGRSEKRASGPSCARGSPTRSACGRSA